MEREKIRSALKIIIRIENRYMENGLQIMEERLGSISISRQ